MHITLSGLHEQASLAHLGQIAGDALQWQPASLFLAEGEMAADDTQRTWVWLYRAPWALLAEGATQDAAAALHQWQTQQRAVLQLRRQLRQGLLLVNADRVQPQALAERLGLSEPVAAGAFTSSPLAAVLAGVFEQLAPECWDVYEALEAAAWLPEGTPEFRATRTAASAQGLVILLDLLRDGNRLPALQTQLADEQLGMQQQLVVEQEAKRKVTAEVNEIRQKLEADNQHLQLRLAESSGELQIAVEESKLLLSQLHQVQEELAAEQEAKRKGTTEVDEIRQKLEADNKHLQLRSAESRGELQTVTEESKLLLGQLHQVQEELEKHFLDNQAAREQLAARDKQLEQARDEYKTATKQLAAEQEAKRTATTQADKAREQLEADSRRLLHQLTESQAELLVATEESELLLSQLHQVQEELERYYLANQKILSTVGQYEHTLHRARRTISQIVSKHIHP